tara:strand:+ start:86 stop:418 length:333 start_codon:yes stop_codon:yes gene_type:complete
MEPTTLDPVVHCTVSDLIDRWATSANDPWYSMLCDIEFPMVALLRSVEREIDRFIEHPSVDVSAGEALIDASIAVEAAVVRAYGDVPVRIVNLTGDVRWTLNGDHHAVRS